MSNIHKYILHLLSLGRTSVKNGVFLLYFLLYFQIMSNKYGVALFH